MINIFDDGQVALDNDPVNMTELESKLADARSQYDQLGVVVRGDGNCDYERVAEVIATCKKVKIQNLNIAVTNQDILNR